MENQISIASENDIFFALSVIRKFLNHINVTEMDRQKVIVSVSELAHNILDHAGGKGFIRYERIHSGIRIVSVDRGPGISDIHAILNGNANSMKHGLGKGLAGVYRLMDDVVMETSAEGTKVIATKWFCRR